MAIFGLGRKSHFPKAVQHVQADPILNSASRGSAADDLTVRDYAQGVPNIRLGEAFKSFARQLPWLIVLCLLASIVAWFATSDFKRVYTADGSLMVQLGDEYVYQPVSGQGGQNGLQLTPDAIVLTEAGIIKNSEVIDAVIGQMTSTPSDSMRFDEAAEKQIRAAGSNQALIREAQMERRKRVDASFVVMPQAKSSIINLAYKHEDPEIAVEALNAFIDQYRVFRRTVFIEGSSDIISKRRIATEEQLDLNEKAIARLLARNNLSDFVSEQEGAQERSEELKASINTVRADIAEAESALAEMEDQLRNTSPTIDLYRDDRASQRIAQAELELGQLLAKYLPSSAPVRQKREELEQLKSVQSGYNGQATGGRRVGPNPNYQELEKNRDAMQARANSLREKEFVLQRQLDSADAKVRRMTKLSPEFLNLTRERVILSDRLNTYNSREQEALINQEQAAANNENVRVISRARYALKGPNMRMVMFALVSIFCWFGLVMIALARVFLDPRLFTAPTRVSHASAAPAYAYADQSSIPEPIAPVYEPERFQPQEYEAQPYNGQNYQQPAYQEQAYYDPAQGQQAYQADNYQAHNQQGDYYAQTETYADPHQGNGSYQGGQTYSSNGHDGEEGYIEPSEGGYETSTHNQAGSDIYANPYSGQTDASYNGMNVLGTLPSSGS